MPQGTPASTPCRRATPVHNPQNPSDGVGWRTRAAPGSELADDLAQGVVGGSELGGDLLEGPPWDEVGPPRLLASVEGVVGLEEVAEAGGVVHDRGSEM